MKKILFLFTLFTGLASFAQTLEAFTYTGALNAGGWTTHSGTAAQLVTLTTPSTSGNSLSYPGLAASTGNRTALSSAYSEDINFPLTNITGNVGYYSFILKVDSTSGLNTGGNYFFGFGGTAGGTVTSLHARLSIRLGSTPNTFNLGIINASGTATYGTTDYAISTNHFVVVRYSQAASPAVADLYVNPTPGGTQPAASTATNSVNATSALGTFASIFIRQSSGTGDLQIDEIRTDSTWAGVTPGAAAGCNIAAAGLTALTCNDGGTGSVPADDYLTFSLNPTGTSLGTTYAVTVSSGTITPTTGTYGTATAFQLQAGSAGAGNVTVTISDNGTSGCTFPVTITDPGACSSASPVFTMSPSSLTGLDHNVGTPSAEQTFTVGGLGLTNNIVLTAPSNFEISLTTGTGFTNSITLTQTGGLVAPTTIYTRGNSPVVGAFSGNIIGTSTGAVNDTVMVSGVASDYTYSTIDVISTVDANGVAISLGQLYEITGVVHCIDFDGNNGYSITLIDGSMEGINLFSFDDVSGYTAPMEGDSLRVFGEIAQYNGLLEIVADSIEVLAQGVATMSPIVVTTLDETTESQVIKMNNLTFVTPITTFPTGSTNIDVTDGTNTFVIRVDSDTDIPGSPAPQGAFNVTGIGGQFDNSSPYTEGYQLFPCGLASFEDATQGLDENTLLNAIRVYPNPVVDELTINNMSNSVVSFEVVDINGKVISVTNTVAQSTSISTSNWNKGVYFVRFSSESATAVVKVVK